MDKVRFTYLENSDDIIISLSCEEGTESGLPDAEYNALIKHFHLINFDNTIKIEIG
ncbi:MAG: hypothetical protein Q6358_03165 [Candidatus Brocadiales bacterium]|nr:hypothetical protein [Candidatus Brocadiales bacterium]